MQHRHERSVLRTVHVHKWGEKPRQAKWISSICGTCGALSIGGVVFERFHPSWGWLLSDTNRDDQGRVI